MLFYIIFAENNNSMDIEDKILQAALAFLGEKELKNNSGFVNKNLQAKMEQIGWQKGQAWCAYFAELVYQQAFDGILKLDRFFTPVAVQTFAKFQNNKHFKTINTPYPGALVVWQNYRNGLPHWTGHMGICLTDAHYFRCESCNQNIGVFSSIEGNTNSKGGREGIEVAIKQRKFSFMKHENGLNLKGFIKYVG